MNISVDDFALHKFQTLPEPPYEMVENKGLSLMALLIRGWLFTIWFLEPDIVQPFADDL